MLLQKKLLIGGVLLTLVLSVGLLGYKAIAIGPKTDDPRGVSYETFKGGVDF